MATEKSIERVLSLLTDAPKAEMEALDSGAGAHAKSMRRILGNDNVVAVGISEKISNEKSTGKLALTFYVEKKIPLKKLNADLAIPPTVAESLGGPEAIPTDVIVLGKIVPEKNPNVTRKKVQPGYSIGHVDISAGTLGAIVKKGGNLCILSNSHVLAVSGTAKNGDAILYPGKADGGKKTVDLVGKLVGFKKFVTGGDFVNHVDCAIASVTPERLPDLVSQIKGLSIPTGTIKPKRGMKVVKVGRTTDKTTGEIRDVHFRFVLDYKQPGVGGVGFVDQVLCTRYTLPGDSGSLVLDKETGKAVGLHFAGANGGSVFNPIDEVLEALDITLVTKALSQSQSKANKRAHTSLKKPGRKNTK